MSKAKSPIIKQSHSRTHQELMEFLKFLPPLVRLFTETFAFASKTYAQVGLSYRWKELLCLPANAVYKEQKRPWQIHLYRTSKTGSLGELWFGRHLPNRLGAKLSVLAEDGSRDLLFRREDGGPVTETYLSAAFRRASSLAMKNGSIKTPITPSHFKTCPAIDIQFLPGSYSSNTLRDCPKSVRDISENQVLEIKELLSNHSGKRGKPRDLPIGDILQILLAQEDFKLSRTEVVEHFPKLAEAALSQKKRWAKKGIWPKILIILQKQFSPNISHSEKPLL